MDVYVDGGGVHVEEEECDGVLAFHEGGVIGLAEGVVDGGVLDGAAVDEDELLGAGGAADAGLADEAAEADAGDLLVGDFEELGGEGGAAEVADAVEEMGGGGELMDDAVLMEQDEGDVGVADGLQLDLVVDVAGLGVFRAEEFAAGGEVVEEGADFDLGAGGVAAIADVVDFAGVDGDLRAGEGAVLACGEAEAGDAGDAGEGLAAKAERGDGGEVEAGAYFAGGVALEAEEGVVAVHACAVVCDADHRASAGADHHLDFACLGVEGVLDELFYHGGGALDDFSGGDLAGDVLWKEGDAAHGDRPRARRRCRLGRGMGFAIGVARRRLTSIIPSDSVKA